MQRWCESFAVAPFSRGGSRGPLWLSDQGVKLLVVGCHLEVADLHLAQIDTGENRRLVKPLKELVSIVLWKIVGAVQLRPEDSTENGKSL